MTISGYYVNGYWLLCYKWLLVVTLLMVINGYFIGGYWYLLMVIILMVIDGYSISGYWWLWIGIILVAILLMAIGDYFVVNHWCVTKKEGSIERTTHLLWPTNPVNWTLLIFSTHTELQTFSHINYWPAPFFYTSQLEDVQTQQYDQPQVSFFFLTTHTGIKQRKFPLHLQNMYNPESTSFLDIKRLTKQQLQCCSESLSLSL